MKKVIRIGTRSSELALWQAETVAELLHKNGLKTEIVKIDTLGDQDQTRPLYRLGITGVFTKNLDIALLDKRIDIAVHSFKDVPTVLPENIIQAAVLQRGNYKDVIVYKKPEGFSADGHRIIATGSLRRKAQWLNRYPEHQVTGLRGNVNTRLKKLEDNDWDGAIFAFAGLDRINVLPEKHIILDWMIPAPAQGAVMVAALESEKEILKICREINHQETEICTKIERDFLRILEGGCSAPIGALATIQEGTVYFKGIVLSPDGDKKIEYRGKKEVSEAADLGKTAARYIIDKGGRKIMRPEVLSERKIRLISTKNLSEDQIKPLFSGITVSMHDFIRTEPVPFRIKDHGKPMEYVVFTSQNAVHYLIKNFPPKDLKIQNIYCVGEKTKQIVEEKIGPVSHFGSSAKELADHLTGKNIDQITYFCGTSRRDELPGILRKHHIEVEEIFTYKTVLTPKKYTENYDGVLFFSPSGVQSFIQKNKTEGLTAFCIGKTTEEEAGKYFKKTIISKDTHVESVVEIVNNTYLNL